MSGRSLLTLAAGVILLGLGTALILWADERLLLLGRNSLLLALGTGGLALPLGTLLAVLISRTNMFGRALAGWVLAALIFLPLYLHFAGWDAGLGDRGWITAALGRPLDKPVLSGWRGAIFVHGIAAVPWVALIVSLGLANVSPSLEQEALQDSSPLKVFFRVTLPRCWHWLGVALLWLVVTVTAEMQITDMFQVRTYAEEIYVGFSLGEQINEASYSLLGQIGLLGTILVIALGTLAHLSPRLLRTDDQPPTRFLLGRWRGAASGLAWLLLLVMLGLPLGNLLAQAGITITERGDQFERSWSAIKIFDLLRAVAFEYSHEIGWSFLMASLAATLALALAAPLAWLARRSRLATGMLVLLAALALAVPGPLVGIGLIRLFNEPQLPLLVWLYNNSIAAPVLAMAIRALPLVLLLLWRAMSGVGEDLVETASVEGASLLQRLTQIGLASQGPALAAAWLLGVALAMGDLAGSILTAPPGVDTLAIRIFGLAHAGVDDQLAGLCLVSELIFLVLASVVYRVMRKTNP